MGHPGKGQGIGVGFPPSAQDRAGAEGPVILTGVGVSGTRVKRGGAQPIQHVHLVWLCASGWSPTCRAPSGLQEVGDLGGQVGVAAGAWESLVQWPLENEADTAMLTSEPGPTKGAGSVESVGAMGQWCLGPVAGSLLRTDVATGCKGMAGWPRVQTEAGLLAKPQGDIGPHEATERTLALLGAPLSPAAPAVVAVDVATPDVDPGLLLVGCCAATGRTGEGQGAEPHRALGPCRVRLLPLGLQLLQRGCPQQPRRRAPQQCGPTQVNEGAVLQHIGLIFHLPETAEGPYCSRGHQTPDRSAAITPAKTPVHPTKPPWRKHPGPVGPARAEKRGRAGAEEGRGWRQRSREG